jgi:hypothetical protein
VRYGPRVSRKFSSTVRSSHHHLVAWPSNLYVCVTGLRQYWESPWATYSRGRSRWRNQFLVDYLKDAGIERSKKQVASHIQVLRNMWKGEKGLYRHSDSSVTRRSPCDQSTNWLLEAKSFSRRAVYLLLIPVFPALLSQTCA